MEIKKFIFKPLTDTTLDLLCQWLNKPHVLEWWSHHLSRDELKEKYGSRIGDPIVCPYIAYYDNRPIAFIQYYWASKIGDGWWENEEDGTVGIDQFIGDENYLDKGYGTLMMKSFIQFLFENPKIRKIITETDPSNLRAKRCYEKAGFGEVGKIDTPDGEAILMEIYKTQQVR